MRHNALLRMVCAIARYFAYSIISILFISLTSILIIIIIINYHIINLITSFLCVIHIEHYCLHPRLHPIPQRFALHRYASRFHAYLRISLYFPISPFLNALRSIVSLTLIFSCPHPPSLYDLLRSTYALLFAFLWFRGITYSIPYSLFTQLVIGFTSLF